jgi:hypothetical protein
VEALGGASGISKSEVSRICQGLDELVKAFLGRPLDHARFPYVYLDATYLHGQGRLKVRPARPWRRRSSLVCSRGMPLRDARNRCPCR